MAGINGFGTTIARGDGGSPETFTEIGNVTSITGPGLSREALDVTAHDSADGYMEFVGGLVDAGEVSIDVNYDPSKHDDLIADFQDADPRNWELVFPDGTKWAFAAILSGFEPSAPHDDKLTASLTMKVSGKPTLTPAV